MADIFDIIDIAFESLNGCVEGFSFHKNRTPDNEKDCHVVVGSPVTNDQDYVSKGYVNVNIYVPRNSNGTERRGIMQDAVRTIRAEIRNLTHPFGMYWKSRILWSKPMESEKKGFDCMNIRIEVITELD